MADEVLNQNVSKIISISQDYLLLGKSAKETEIKIYLHGDDYEASKLKVENMMRVAAYAEAINNGVIVLPKYEKVEKPHIKVVGDQ
jgi:hypothetical protein